MSITQLSKHFVCLDKQFSDLLLLCSSRLRISAKIPSAPVVGHRGDGDGHQGKGERPSYRLRARFAVDNMQVLEGDNLLTENTFYVRDDHKSVELYTQ